MFLEELSSQETGKEALLKDLRAWLNNLSAFLSPLILTKWYSVYIFKKAIAIFSDPLFQFKKKIIHHSQHQERICDKRNSEVFNLP